MESDRAKFLRDYAIFKNEAARSVSRVCWRVPVVVSLVFATLMFVAAGIVRHDEQEWLGVVCIIIAGALVVWSGWRAFNGRREACCPLCGAILKVDRTSFGHRLECSACGQVAEIENNDDA